MELKASIESIKCVYPDKKLTGIFMPHLYSRTRDLADSFAQSLSMLDEAILLPIYPAREQPIPGVTSELVARDIRPGVFRGVVSMKEVPQLIDRIADSVEVLVTVGAGDLDNLADYIAERLGREL